MTETEEKNSPRSMGVEEELLLVDPDTGLARSVAEAVVGPSEGSGPEELSQEFQREQVETGTRPCVRADDLAVQIRNRRQRAADRAREAGAEVAALGTSPLAVEPSLTPESRYRRMAAEFGLTAQEQLTCGCHVHVQVDSDEEGAAVLDRIRPWLPVLTAMSANSPFWQGNDSGYRSYRSLVWGRWPTAGPYDPFGSADGYRQTVHSLLATGTILDEGMVYFDARLSRHWPTVEIRVADVCLDADDAVLLALLVRGLVETAAREWRAGRPPAPVPTSLLRLAGWRAARSGLEGQLLDPGTCRPVPAEDAVRTLLGHLAPALDDAGDLRTATDLTERLLARGNGARIQRSVVEGGGGLADVVAEAVKHTLV
ncbi:glutamate--cysteine ligase [Streptomyces thermolineatus]|uniref:Putative glutamate--cysteine ligase 2 n=2 Tax=Streptomyces thermolineatus TaxID=44033 RepID=A0ABN3M372_9ACTN